MHLRLLHLRRMHMTTYDGYAGCRDDTPQDGHSAAGTCTGAAMSAGENSYEPRPK